MAQEEEIAHHVSHILSALGVSPNAPGTLETPKRVAKYLCQAVKRPDIGFKVFDSFGADEMIVQNGIRVTSLCEHHLLTFGSSISIGYIPRDGKVCGLSKLARIAEHFAASLTIQERLTREIGEFLTNNKELKPYGVGVSVRSYHMCMVARGCRQDMSTTMTQFLSGVIKEDPSARQEFLGMVEHVPL